MRIAEVIGTVTLNRWENSLAGASWKIVTPLALDGLRGNSSGRGEPFVVFDELGTNEGHRVAVSEGAEAVAPFHPAVKPIDGYIAAIIDHLELEPAPLQATDS